MRHVIAFRKLFATSVLAIAVGPLASCDAGPAVEQRPQSITFGLPPTPALNETSAKVAATASSGLPVRYTSSRPSICSVDPGTGAVTALAGGTCTIAANQGGDSRYAPAPQVTQDVVFTFRDVVAFTGPPPALIVHDQATLAAVATSGLPVSYTTVTPTACSVDAGTALVTALSVGDCTIIASAGDAEATQTVAITAPSAVTAPGAPSGLVATAGDVNSTVAVRIGGIQAGGTPITGFSVSSSPPGVTATSAGMPMTVTCPSSCSGYRFSVTATNAVGLGPSSLPAEIVTRYRVVATFREPDTQPNDSIFVGAFSFNATTGAASDLSGVLSESMTGGSSRYPNDTMTWVPLEHQLSSIPVQVDGAEGLLITTFRLDSTNTLSAEPRFGGTDGWSPGSGSGLYFGYPSANPENAYARIFVNVFDPTAALTQAQLDRLAYADCTPGGMMGASCMTGTSVASYGTAGTMGGHPVSQTIVRQ
jgi:hypothetical protein